MKYKIIDGNRGGDRKREGEMVSADFWMELIREYSCRINLEIAAISRNASSLSTNANLLHFNSLQSPSHHRARPPFHSFHGTWNLRNELFAREVKTGRTTVAQVAYLWN